MEAFTKVVRIGSHNIYGRKVSVFCRVAYNQIGLSITGVEGPKHNGDAHGSCGQIVMHLKSEMISEFAPGWDIEKAAQFLTLWDRWHLNNMRAGSPAQRAWILEHRAECGSGSDHYTRTSELLAAAGLNPDPNCIHGGKPYKYGSAWLKEDVPDEVLEFFKALPDTDIQPAWV